MLLVTKSDSHICCMAIWDHTGNHHIDKCSQHVCFSVWTVNCYLHAYNTEWYHLCCTLHRQFCTWQLIMCIRCSVRHIYREVFSIDREKVHHAHFMLHHNSSPAKDGYMSSLFIEMKMIHQIISDESSKQHNICDQQLFRVVTWKHFSQFTCVLWQKGLMWVHLYFATYQTDMV